MVSFFSDGGNHVPALCVQLDTMFFLTEKLDTMLMAEAFMSKVCAPLFFLSHFTHVNLSGSGFM
jgi:hypothetical protein